MKINVVVLQSQKYEHINSVINNITYEILKEQYLWNVFFQLNIYEFGTPNWTHKAIHILIPTYKKLIQLNIFHNISCIYSLFFTQIRFYL